MKTSASVKRYILFFVVTEKGHGVNQILQNCLGADRVIDCLDNSYEAMLGKWFGNCTKLSIGEWQKIAYKASECFALRMLTYVSR